MYLGEKNCLILLNARATIFLLGGDYIDNERKGLWLGGQPYWLAMRERGIHMSFGVGGIAKPMCELLEEGLIGKLVDTQDFDEYAIGSIDRNPNHFCITAGEYANPFNKGAFVNKLDFVILAALEVDVNFNCNVVTDYGIAINPKRTDLIEATKDAGLPIKTIEELRDIAYAIVGTPDKVQFGDRVVGIIEARDGTIMDVVRAVKEYEFAD